MFKRFALCFLLVLSVLPASLAAQSNASTMAPAVWRYVAFDSKTNPEFVEQWTWTGCAVKIRRDGRGIQVVAEIERGGDIFHQTINIFARQKDRSNADFEFTKMRRGDVKPSFLPNDGSQWDIFGSEFSSAARALPSSVKKLFFGLYGLK